MEKFTPAELAYFAGIVDGEGSVSFQAHIQRSGFLRITPYICVMNTDQGILDFCWRIMNGLCEGSTDAHPRWCNVSLKAHETSFQGYLPCKNMRLDGVATRLVIEPIIPYLQGIKKQNCISILKYLSLRDNQTFMRNSKGQLRRAGYTREQLEIVASARRHKSATTLERMLECPNIIDAFVPDF